MRCSRIWRPTPSFGRAGSRHASPVPTHFIVVEDVERSRRFSADVLGGEVVVEGVLSVVALANGINVGGLTEHKPRLALETPHDLDRMASFLNIRVADIEGSTPTGARRGLPDAAPPARDRNSLLCWRL
jgi:catechol 2,3-dioxygenase-like lactoylglutathione lyase family enzyme